MQLRGSCLSLLVGIVVGITLALQGSLYMVHTTAPHATTSEHGHLESKLQGFLSNHGVGDWVHGYLGADAEKAVRPAVGGAEGRVAEAEARSLQVDGLKPTFGELSKSHHCIHLSSTIKACLLVLLNVPGRGSCCCSERRSHCGCCGQASP